MAASSSACGTGWRLSTGMALGPTTGQGGSPRSASACTQRAMALPPGLQPCLAAAVAQLHTGRSTTQGGSHRATAASGAIWSSRHRPRSPWVLRPRCSTAVAPVNTSAAPPSANRARWMRCQSLAHPCTAAYCCIGEISTRLRSARPRSVAGWNSSGPVTAGASLMSGVRPGVIATGIQGLGKSGAADGYLRSFVCRLFWLFVLSDRGGPGGCLLLHVPRLRPWGPQAPPLLTQKATPRPAAQPPPWHAALGAPPNSVSRGRGCWVA